MDKRNNDSIRRTSDGWKNNDKKDKEEEKVDKLLSGVGWYPKPYRRRSI